jgi:glycosyltransferase involved in cell wall biosynthesis/ribosomal protein S18 acetylase RimI-like enzyme
MPAECTLRHSMNRPVRVAHVTTVDLSLRFLLRGQLTAIRDAGFEVAGISAPGPWAAGLEADGIRHIPWPHATRAWDPRADGRAFLELVRILRRERFDVLHTHNPKPGILGRVAARPVGVPCVVNTVHGLYATPHDRAAKRLPILALERLAGRFSDLELYQSEEDLAWARRIGLVTPEKSVLLGNGIDVGEFDPAGVDPRRLAALREELGIGESALVVGTVGRLVAEKGYRELFAAARELRQRRRDVCFLAVGGPDFDKADAIRAEELDSAQENVIVTGWREDGRDLLGLMDVFVLASWREGLPRSAIEAAAMGRPLVLTNIRGCREVARDGVEAVLVPPGERAPLCAAIEGLLDDPVRRERMGSAARERAVERFDERRVFGLVIDAYRDLLPRDEVPRVRPGANVRLRPARRADAPSLAHLHRHALPEAFLPTLGDRFLRTLYRALADSPVALSIVAERDGAVVGFATGVLSTRAFSRAFYRRHGPRALATALPRLLRPAVARRVIETAHYAGGTGSLPEPELLSIGVDTAERGSGLGRRLATEMLSGLAELGADQVKVLVGAGNRDANAMFARMGLHRADTVALHDGVASNVWVTECRS